MHDEDRETTDLKRKQLVEIKPRSTCKSAVLRTRDFGAHAHLISDHYSPLVISASSGGGQACDHLVGDRDGAI